MEQGITSFITKHDDGEETLSISLGSFDIVVSDNEVKYRARLFDYDQPATRYKFPRRCDITGRGMWEGYCFGDGQDYAIDKAGATTLAMQYGYDTLEEAYEDGAYYYTTWEDIDEEEGWYESEHQDGSDAIYVEQ